MSITARLVAAQTAVHRACLEAGRAPSEVKLIPISKYHPSAAIKQVAAEGYDLFGESRIQEVIQKRAELGDAVRFAFIGHVQTNKAKVVAELADEVHSLDSLRLAEKLQVQLEKLGKKLPVLVQVNTSGEAAKSGVALTQAYDFARSLKSYDALEPRGFMTMAMKTTDETAIRGCFQALARLRDQVRQADGGGWEELSMGMSGDFALAIAEGATMVRIGSAIFGPRPAP